MACNVCGEKVETCENCLVELAKSDFYCFEDVHFCDKECWKQWLIEEEKGKLEKAEDDKDEKEKK